MLKVKTLRTKDKEFLFNTWEEFFEWLYENYRLTKDNFYGSNSHRSNPEGTIHQITTWDVALTLEMVA